MSSGIPLLPCHRAFDLEWGKSVAKPARHLACKCKFFVFIDRYKVLISKEMKNDNDLNLHSMTKLSG